MDMSRVVLSGASAGAWLAAQLALGQCSDKEDTVDVQRQFCGIALQYPLLDLSTPAFVFPSEPMMGYLDSETLKSHLWGPYCDESGQISNGSDITPDSLRNQFFRYVQQKGLFPRFIFGPQASQHPLAAETVIKHQIRKAPSAWRLPTFIIHGARDTAVSVDQSRDFVQALLSADSKPFIEYVAPADKDQCVAVVRQSSIHDEKLTPGCDCTFPFTACGTVRDLVVAAV